MKITIIHKIYTHIQISNLYYCLVVNMEVIKMARILKDHKPWSLAGLLVAMGIVYGDIGTSPMYVMKSIVSGNGGLLNISPDFILGSLSLVIWTLILLTTLKYVIIAMQADNHGEGGIFSLYSLVKHCKKWLIIPAMIGGAALLADGVLTPAVTVTTAIEGLKSVDIVERLIGDNQHIIVITVIIIISLLFLIQRLGTSSIGKAFGPVMMLWFSALGILGIMNMFGHLEVLRAFNPIRAVHVLFGPYNKAGFMILGSVFLATTGAEALYSDMGHVGKYNIYLSWPFVKICLILNYLGQGAWLLANQNSATLATVEDMNPFFLMVPETFRAGMVIIGTLAAIIASQALITGAFTLVSEASRLDLMPHLQIIYPSSTKGQLYIPLVNYSLWISCILVVLYFKTSAHMEAAYGLSITITMLMTTLLLFEYLRKIKKRHFTPYLFLLFFGGLEGAFFLSSLTKFTHGGYIALLIAFLLFIIMVVWYRGTSIEKEQLVELPIAKYIPMFEKLRQDNKVMNLADNLVFLTNSGDNENIDRDILYSIFDKGHKKAKAYWFVSVSVTDDPYTLDYSVEKLYTNYIYRVHLYLGFKVEQRVNVYMRQIITDLIKSGEHSPQEDCYSIYGEQHVGNFSFCLIHKHLVPESDISVFDRMIISTKYAIRQVAGSPAKWYGLENTSLIIENVPLFVKLKKTAKIRRIKSNKVH